MEVKDKRHFIHPVFDIISPEREEPKGLGSQYQVINETKSRKMQIIF